ncbi:MAG: DUF6722 family protein [Nitrospirota bacterium]
MRHEDRRKEAGKMLMDVTKYLLTVGVIGGFLSEKFPYVSGIILFVVALVVFIAGFYSIPPKKEGS